MTRAWLVAALFVAGPAHADSVLIRNAIVHTMGSAGTLANTDILVIDGTIEALGRALDAPAQARVIDAQGQPVTP
ncbi:MAG: amidohydrolase, partial [Gemmatimonadetes bacterium]|nr:amidohydrolase [Gemmatimonadota bacterium]